MAGKSIAPIDAHDCQRVTSGSQKQTFTVAQTQPLPSVQHFRQVATVTLQADVETVLEIMSAETSDFVILDALQRLPVDGNAEAEE